MTEDDRRLRVVHVVDSLAESGGAERRLVEEVLAIGARLDHRVVRLYERNGLQPQLEAAGIPVVGLGLRAGHAGRTWPVAASRLRRLLRAWRPDVVHTTLFAGNLVGQLAARPLGIPVVSSFNRTGDIDLQRALQPGVAGWRGRVMQSVARRAGRSGDVHFRAVSAYARETNCALFDVPPERVTVIPRGISVGHQDPVERAELGVGDGPLFVNAARLVSEKAQHLLVEAFAEARRHLPDAELLIAGAPGSAEAAVRAAVDRTGVGDAVHLLGWRADVLGVVAAADVFVFSSLSEGSPSAVIEAMAVGTPVVAFDIPPVAELTGRDDARLVPAGSTSALAEAMVAAATAPDRDATVAAARDRARRFDLATVADELADLLTVTAFPGHAGRAGPLARWRSFARTGTGARS